jgi:hypothetical protein
MIEVFSLRKCAELLHDEVSHVTLFYWRHKILAALKQIPIETFQGIVEMDETYFLFSEKGKRNISDSPVNVVAKLNIVASVTTKYVYWLLVTVRK